MTNLLSTRDGGKTNEEGEERLSSRLMSTFGVIDSGDYAVTQNDTPDMSVKAAAGDAVIPYLDYGYHVWASSVNNPTITANSSGNPRIDAVVLWVDRSVVDDSSNNNPGASKVTVVAGTPHASPSAPSDSDIQTAIGASNPFIRLANVAVASGASSIINANITDMRTFIILQSNARPVATQTGAETLTNKTIGDTLNMTTGNITQSGAAAHITLTPGTNKLVRVAVLRQDNTSNAYSNNTVFLVGWGYMNNAAGDRISEAVTFGLTFSAVPIVLISGLGKTTGSVSGIGSFDDFNNLSKFISTLNITTTSFDAVIEASATGSLNAANTKFGYSWLAVGTF